MGLAMRWIVQLIQMYNYRVAFMTIVIFIQMDAQTNVLHVEAAKAVLINA